jgi:hypothetical protein
VAGDVDVVQGQPHAIASRPVLGPGSRLVSPGLSRETVRDPARFVLSQAGGGRQAAANLASCGPGGFPL